MANRLRSSEEVFAVLDGALPELPRLLDAARGAPLYVVGGTVRDLFLGRGRTDLDIAVEGDAAQIARRLGGDVVEHPRFATAKAVVGGVGVDLAAARAESYERPGALPEVSPAQIEADLARRDFTVNAMALSLGDKRHLIDPHGGLDDLAAGRLRVLHDASFRDDPTRALRAARYAARFGFQPEPETLRLLVATDLDTVSADRQRAELLRICAEPAAPEALRLLDEWGVLEMAAGAPALCESVAELLSGPPWNGTVARAEALLAALEGLTFASGRADEWRGAHGPGPGAGAGRRLAGSLRRRVEGGRDGDRRQGPDRRRGPTGPGRGSRPAGGASREAGRRGVRSRGRVADRA
jgi:hypothetical protein